MRTRIEMGHWTTLCSWALKFIRGSGTSSATTGFLPAAGNLGLSTRRLRRQWGATKAHRVVAGATLPRQSVLWPPAKGTNAFRRSVAKVEHGPEAGIVRPDGTRKTHAGKDLKEAEGLALHDLGLPRTSEQHMDSTAVPNKSSHHPHTLPPRS